MNKQKLFKILGIVFTSVGGVGAIVGSSMSIYSANRTYDIDLKTIQGSIKEFIKPIIKLQTRLLINATEKVLVKGVETLSGKVINLFTSGANVTWKVNNVVSAPISYDPLSGRFEFNTTERPWVLGKNTLTVEHGKRTASIDIVLKSIDDCRIEIVPNTDIYSDHNGFTVEKDTSVNLKSYLKLGDRTIYDARSLIGWQEYVNNQWQNVAPEISTANTLFLSNKTIGNFKYRAVINNSNKILSTDANMNVVPVSSTITRISNILVNKDPIVTTVELGKEVLFEPETSPAVNPSNNWQYSWIVSYREDWKEVEEKFSGKTLNYTFKKDNSYNVKLIIKDNYKIVTADTYVSAKPAFNFNANYNLGYSGNLLHYFGSLYYIGTGLDVVLKPNFVPDWFYNGDSLIIEHSLYKLTNNKWNPTNITYLDGFSIPPSAIDNGLNKFKMVLNIKSSTNPTQSKEINIEAAFTKIDNINQLPNKKFSFGIGSLNWYTLSIDGTNFKPYEESVKNIFKDYDKYVNDSNKISEAFKSNGFNRQFFLVDILDSISSNKTLLIAFSVIAGVLGSLLITGIVLLILWSIDKRKSS